MLYPQEIIAKMKEYEQIISKPAHKWGSFEICGFYYWIQENKSEYVEKYPWRKNYREE